MMNIRYALLVLPIFFISLSCTAGTTGSEVFHHPLYVGAAGGFGSTTWKGLVPNQQNQNAALTMSTPIDVKEGGTAWGLFAGYEFTPYFAVEASYMKYPDARILFDSLSLFSFNNNGALEFTTKTESVHLMGKIMLLIPDTRIRVYSSAGIADVHRSDVLINQWLLSPTFGAGVNYHLNDQWYDFIRDNFAITVPVSSVFFRTSFVITKCSIYE